MAVCITRKVSEATVINDLSPRVVSLARAIDRLPPGAYTISITKHDLKTLGWDALINRIEQVQALKITPSGEQS